MKKRKTLFGVIVLLAVLALFFHLRHPSLAVSASTARATVVQNGLKAVAFAGSVEQDKPQSVGKIDLLSFNDTVFRPELVQLHKKFWSYLGLYQREHGVTFTQKQQFNIARALAVARLSQTLYEAEIARIDDNNPNQVKISIPSYAGQGGGIRDFLVDKITKSTQDPKLSQALADSFAGSFSRYGAYPQDVEMTQKTIAGVNGKPLTVVMLTDRTMTKTQSGLVVSAGNNASFMKDQMQEYAPFMAFMK